MKLSKITHRQEVRICVDFAYNAEVTARLRQVADTRWSQTLKCWHIPYTKEAYEQLKELFPEAEIIEHAFTDKSNTKAEKQTKPVQTEHSEQKSTVKVFNFNRNTNETNDGKLRLIKKAEIKQDADISITITAKRIFVQLPKNDTDTQFLGSFRYVHWDNNNRQWTIPNYGKNLELIKNYFRDRNVAITEQQDEVIVESKQTIAEANTLKALNIQNRILRIYFVYNRTLIEAIKKIALSRWNSSENCWTVPYNEQNIEALQQLSQTNGLKWEYQLISKTEGLPRQPKHANYLRCPVEYTEKLKELRYSINTLNVYTDLFEEFLNYYPDRNAKDLTEEEIITFLRYLVNDRKISTSYQNQSINAIHPVGFKTVKV